MYSEDETTKYNAQKISLSKQFIKSITTILPKNTKGLKNFYLDIIDLINEVNEYELEYGGSIQKNNLQGYRFVYKNDEGKNLYETNMFYVNENLYSFSHYNENGLIETDRDYFFDSIVFSKEHDLHQYPVKKISSTKKIALGLVIALILSFLIRVNSKRNKAT